MLNYGFYGIYDYSYWCLQTNKHHRGGTILCRFSLKPIHGKMLQHGAMLYPKDQLRGPRYRYSYGLLPVVNQ